MNELPENVIDAIERGREIEAIKLLREQTGMGLAEARQAVLSYGAARESEPLPPSAEVVALLDAGKRKEAVRLYQDESGLGLREARVRLSDFDQKRGLQAMGMETVGGSGGLVAVIVAAIVLAAIYWWLSG